MNPGKPTSCPGLALSRSVSGFYTLSDKALPNTGVMMALSKEEAFKASISVLTAIRASGCVNKKPSSQNEAGPTLPWKTKGWREHRSSSSSCRSRHHVKSPIPDACWPKADINMFLFIWAVRVSTGVTSQVGTRRCFGLDSVATRTALALMVYLIRKVVGKLELAGEAILELAKSSGAAWLAVNHLLTDTWAVESFFRETVNAMKKQLTATTSYRCSNGNELLRRV